MTTSTLLPVIITYCQGVPKPWTRPKGPGDRTSGEHLSGWLTAAQLQAITGSQHIRPWLGVVLITDDGPDVYDAEQVQNDLGEVASILSHQLQRPVHAAPLATLDDLELADLMTTMLFIMDAHHHIEAEFIIPSLAETEPALIAKALHGYYEQDPALATA